MSTLLLVNIKTAPYNARLFAKTRFPCSVILELTAKMEVILFSLKRQEIKVIFVYLSDTIADSSKYYIFLLLWNTVMKMYCALTVHCYIC